MTKKPKTSTRTREARSLNRRVRQLTDELLSMNYGHPSQEMGDRLAIKKAYGTTERDLGGRCRQSIEMLLRRHLSNDKALPLREKKGTP